MAVIRSTVIGGVPVLFTEGDGGTVRGGIIVRSGFADERLAIHGVSRLIEHLVVREVGGEGRGVTGAVTATTTSFEVEGDREEVEAALGEVCRALVPVPADQLLRDRGPVSAELAAAATAPGVWEQIAALRFGFRGAGLAPAPEFALRTLQPPEIQEWAQERFTAGNAVVWMTAEPEQLELHLPTGGRVPAPAPEHLDGVAWPAFHAATPIVTLSVVAAASEALDFALQVACDRATARLIDDDGIMGGVQVVQRRLGNGLVLAGLECDAGLADGATVVATLVDVFEELADGAAEDAEVDRVLQARRNGEATAADLLQARALDHLEGLPVRSPEELAAFEASVSAGSIGAALAQVMPSLLVTAPPATPMPRGLQGYHRFPPVLAERLFTDRSAAGRGGLMLGPGGIARRDMLGQLSEVVPAAEVEAVEWGLGGLRTVHGLDGTAVPFDLACLENADEATAVLRDLRPENHVPLDPSLQLVDDAIRAGGGAAMIAPGAAERIAAEAGDAGHDLVILPLDQHAHPTLTLAVLADAVLVVLPSGYGPRIPAADLGAVEVRGRSGRQLAIPLGDEIAVLSFADDGGGARAARLIEERRGTAAAAGIRPVLRPSDLEAARELLAVKPLRRPVPSIPIAVPRVRMPRVRMPRVRIPFPGQRAGFMALLAGWAVAAYWVLMQFVPVPQILPAWPFGGDSKLPPHQASSPFGDLRPITPAERRTASFYDAKLTKAALKDATKALGKDPRIASIVLRPGAVAVLGRSGKRTMMISVSLDGVVRKSVLDGSSGRAVRAKSIDPKAVAALVEAAGHEGVDVSQIDQVSAHVLAGGKIEWRLVAGSGRLIGNAHGTKVHLG